LAHPSTETTQEPKQTPIREKNETESEKETSGIKLSPTKLEDLRARVTAEAKEKLKAQSKISLEAIKEIWEDYRNNNSSTSTKSAMSQTIMDFADKTIYIKVPSAATKNIILQETALMDRLRQEFGMTDLLMDIQIDVSCFPEYEETKTVVIKSQRETLEDLIQKNRHILTFMESLDLKLDS
jgi:hypothetical protein